MVIRILVDTSPELAVRSQEIYLVLLFAYYGCYTLRPIVWSGGPAKINLSSPTSGLLERAKEATVKPVTGTTFSTIAHNRFGGSCNRSLRDVSASASASDYKERRRQATRIA
ncbi:hypothetical protein E4U55_005012 [Claviceps digitariae]|nr:hypothetical protein E4U55_005012 [Claviceps digitariae]